MSVCSCKYGRYTNMNRNESFKAQEQFTVADQFTMVGTVLDLTDCKLLLGNTATKSYMSNV